MKDIVNPLVLLSVVALVACHVGADSDGLADGFLIWALALCATAFIVDGILAIARAIAHRKVLMPVVWAFVFLVLGCCLFATAKGDASVSGEEMESFRVLNEARLAGGDVWARDDSGECLLTLAASLGKNRVVKELVQGKSGEVPAETLQEAALRAAENGRAEALRLLLDAGASLSAVYQGTTLLCAAAQNGRTKAVECLLERGAEPNLADEEGVTPLIHAVVAENAAVVRLLRQYGAVAAKKDAQGRDAASYARSEAVSELLGVPQP